MRLLAVSALAAAAALLLGQSSPTPESRALKIEFLVGDRCFFNQPLRQPADCHEDPPCMWIDADVLVRERAAGGFEAGAYARGWIEGRPVSITPGTPPPKPPRRFGFEAESTEALAKAPRDVSAAACAGCARRVRDDPAGSEHALWRCHRFSRSAYGAAPSRRRLPTTTGDCDALDARCAHDCTCY